MLSIPGQRLLDKDALVGGCRRLRITCERDRLATEVAALPASYWGQRGGRVGVHTPAEAVFLRGYAPAEGERPIEERDALAHLPYVRELIHSIIPAQPMRCLLAALPPGAAIMPHIDRATYFSQTIRIHVPIVTCTQVWMFANGLSYHMAAGEIWALNNCNVHGVWNADDACARIHLICDFLPSDALLRLLADAERDLGIDEPEVRKRLFAAPAGGAAAHA